MMTEDRRIFPILRRPTPIYDAVKAINPPIRPALGFIASNKSEIRTLRMRILGGLATAVGAAILVPTLVARVRGLMK